ncbi:MAG: AMP-binding protein [SAR324 cluster bacterium]|nr:AMP-binding protein [SAR324 cluster bacterium]
MLTFGQLVRRNGVRWAEKDAFIELERRIGWAEFDRRTDALGGALRGLGVAPGDRVAMLAYDCIEVAELFIACAKIGAVRVGINARLAAPEIAHLIRNAGPVLLFVQAAYTKLAADALSLLDSAPEQAGFGGGHGCLHDYEELIGRGQSDSPLEMSEGGDVMLAYTTGSTGMPKGAIYPHAAMLQSMLLIGLSEGMRQDDVWLHAMPAGGIPIMHMLRGTFHGAPTVIVGPWNPERALALIERERVTITVLVPTQLTALLKCDAFEAHDLSSLRQLAYGASPLPPATIREGMERFGCPFLQMYGTTELMGMSMMLFPDDHRRGLSGQPEILASAGKALPYVETAIVNDDGAPVAPGETGELIVKTDFIVPGYRNAPEAYAEAVREGWLHTGDMARQDAQGYIYLGDRAKFRIKTGGYNVFPTEVENVLAEHPSVHEVSVVGLPDETWGERIHAVVVLKPGRQAETEELREYCRGKIADFKVPKTVEIWTDLPKGATGKILKRQIIASYTEE